MRISGGLFVVLIIAVGFVLYLTATDLASSTDAVKAVASDLREANVEGAEFDREQATAMIDAMEMLLAAPELLAESVEELKTFAASAAAWARDAELGEELHAAVLIRRAAGELRAYALQPDDRHLMRARRSLEAARSTVEGHGHGTGVDGGPGLAVGAVRDQLDNLEQSQRERHQEAEESLRD
jgi:hypothetical protein